MQKHQRKKLKKERWITPGHKKRLKSPLLPKLSLIWSRRQRPKRKRSKRRRRRSKRKRSMKRRSSMRRRSMERRSMKRRRSIRRRRKRRGASGLQQRGADLHDPLF